MIEYILEGTCYSKTVVEYANESRLIWFTSRTEFPIRVLSSNELFMVPNRASQTRLLKQVMLYWENNPETLMLRNFFRGNLCNFPTVTKSALTTDP